jgi:hypothetical protein
VQPQFQIVDPALDPRFAAAGPFFLFEHRGRLTRPAPRGKALRSVLHVGGV